MFDMHKQIGHRGHMSLAGLALVWAMVIAPAGPTAVGQTQPERVEQQETLTLAQQIAQLRASLIRLERQIESQSSGRDNIGQGSIGSGGKGGPMGKGGLDNKGQGKMGKGNMGKGGMEKGNKAGGKGGGMGGSGGMSGAKSSGTAAMGSMTGSAAAQAALPGFPGVSHLYHIGAASFFLDHDEHITLALDQRAALGRLGEEAQLQAATFERRRAQLEQELWMLTAADEPDIVLIEEKVRLITRAGGDQRLAFIRAVGKAAQILTEAQRESLIGMAPAMPSVSTTGEAHEHDGG